MRVPPAELSKDDIEEVEQFAQVLAEAADGDSAKWKESVVRRAREQGFGLHWGQRDDDTLLTLEIGNTGSPVAALARFPSDILGLTLTRTNPYRLLELRPGEAPPTPTLPQVILKALPNEIRIPREATWSSALAEIAEKADLDVISDDYQFRKKPAAQGASTITIPKGTPVVETLDRVCLRFGYLWWEKEGCCYFRSRTWAGDDSWEVPDRVLTSWRNAVSAQGRFGAAEVAALADLTQKQRLALQRRAPQIVTAEALDREDVGQFLRWFKSLSAYRRGLLVQGGLTASVQDFTGLDWLTTRFSDPQRKVSLRLSQEIVRDPGATQIQFTLTSSWGPNQSANIKWSVSFPTLDVPATSSPGR